MDCAAVREVLSEYFDGELRADLGTQVSEHLGHCRACRQQLAGFEELAKLAAALSVPEPPARIWNALERRLGEHVTMTATEHRRQRFGPVLHVVAFAATVLMAVGVGWFVSGRWWGTGGSARWSTAWGDYLNEFQHDPAAAQHSLLAAYDHTAVGVEDAVRHVGYRPAVADGLPPGYTIETTHIVRMPGCTCVQALCRRDDGSVLAIFEHNDAAMSHFGDRPGTPAECQGQPCCLIDLHGQMAATWQRGRRNFAAVGVRDVDELGSLMAWLDH